MPASKINCPLTRMDRAGPTRVGWHGRMEWTLQFDCAESRPMVLLEVRESALASIDIDGLAPEHLVWLQVVGPAGVVFSMSSQEGRTGHVTTAGDMVHALSSMHGRPGLSIDAEHFGQQPCRASLSLHMRVRIDEPGNLNRIQVHAKRR